MPLTKEETLQQEYFVLEKQDNELQEKIFELKRKKQDIKREIASLTAGIKLLEKQKVEKSWKITCLNIITFGIFKYYKNKKINNQIKRKQGVLEELRKQIAENTKIKHSLKNKKLKVARKLIKIVKSLWSNSREEVNNVQNKFQQEISQKLDIILKHQIGDAKSSFSLEQDSSGYNSDDEQQSPINSRSVSRQNSEEDILKQSPAVTCQKLNFDDDSDIETLSRSSSLDSLSRNELDESLVNNPVSYWLTENNSNDEQCSNLSSQISARRNIKNNIFGFQNKLSNIMEDDDGIDVILEPEEKEVRKTRCKEHTPLLRHDSKDSGFGSESEHPIFNQSLIKDLDDILEKYRSVKSHLAFTNKI